LLDTACDTRTPCRIGYERAVREYRLTDGGRKQLQLERARFRRMNRAIETILENA
jgi:DNA-binding PadR family transcriptional regulator